MVSRSRMKEIKVEFLVWSVSATSALIGSICRDFGKKKKRPGTRPTDLTPDANHRA